MSQQEIDVMSKKSSTALVEFDPTVGALNTNQHSNVAMGMINSLSDMGDENLINFYASVVSTDKTMFVVRGATAQELFNRATAGDNGFFNGVKDQGKNVIIKEIAKEIGAEYSTLVEDIQVMDELGAALLETLQTSPEALLPREYYVLASRTDVPNKTLGYFEDQRSSLSYTTGDARRDTKKLRNGATIATVKKEDAAERKLSLDAKAKAPKGKKGEKAPRPLHVQLEGTYANQYFLRKVVEKYGNLNAFFVKRCTEEFGEAPLPPVKEKPKAKPKAKAKIKKTAPKKGSVQKAPARRKATTAKK